MAAILAVCGLQHHEKTFQAEGYSPQALRNAIKQGNAAARSDLRDLKLNLGESRRLINHVSGLSCSAPVRLRLRAWVRVGVRGQAQG
jgi:hypothetical protein